MPDHRLEAKALAGEPGRVWGRERVPVVTTRGGKPWRGCAPALVALRGGRYGPWEHDNERACSCHDNEGQQGAWHEWGACRRLFGADACRRRGKGRGNAPW
jgi:hypothetical protein